MIVPRLQCMTRSVGARESGSTASHLPASESPSDEAALARTKSTDTGQPLGTRDGESALLTYGGVRTLAAGEKRREEKTASKTKDQKDWADYSGIIRRCTLYHTEEKIQNKCLTKLFIKLVRPRTVSRLKPRR